MRKTVLQLVQDILSSIDGDEVNSISDTTESLQVVKCLETTYWDIVGKAEFPKHFTFFNLDPSGNPLQPTIMYLPDTQLTLQWVRYNVATTDDPSANFVDVPFQDPDTFLQRMYMNNSEESTVDEFVFTQNNGDDITILARNDKFPSCYTTFDDRTMIFDSFNSSEDTTLQESKTMGYGELIPTWTTSDSFTPDLPAEQFSLLFNEAKALAWAEIKQAQNVVAEKRARKGWIRTQKNKRHVNQPRSELDRLPNYGRNSGIRYSGTNKANRGW